MHCVWCIYDVTFDRLNGYAPVICSGPYIYTTDLLHLQKGRPVSPQLPAKFLYVESPLKCKWGAWQEMMAGHPNQEFAAFILRGILEGFRIGFDSDHALVSARRNTPSAQQHPKVVEQYLTKEITAGRIIGPFSPIDIPGVQVSRMGVIPKAHQPNKWRLITDLSFPPHTSVNDGIDSSLCSMQYTSVSKVARAAQSMGRGALMAKLDIEAAYRLVSVHTHCWVFSGMIPSTSMGACRSDSGLPRRFSQPSRMPWSGASDAVG